MFTLIKHLIEAQNFVNIPIGRDFSRVILASEGMDNGLIAPAVTFLAYIQYFPPNALGFVVVISLVAPDAFNHISRT